MGREYGMVMVTIRTHTSHKLQPLYRTVYGPFTRYCNSAQNNWMRENPATTFSIYGIAQLEKKRLSLHSLQVISCLAFEAL